jgi:ankyrin repeat protein
LALGGAQLTTCKAAAAISSDTRLLAAWLRAVSHAPFLLACKGEQWKVALYLLSSDGLQIPCQHLKLALNLAAARGQAQLVEAILPLMKPIDDTSSAINGNPAGDLHPLVWAALQGHVDVCKAFLTAKAAGPRAARDAACAAAASGHLELVQLLVECGIPGVDEAEAGGNPLISAAAAGHAGVVEYLLDLGLDPVNRKDTPWSMWGGAQVLITAASASGSCAVLQLLLDRGQQHWSNKHWVLAVSKAAEAAAPDSVRLLLDRMPAGVRSSLDAAGHKPLQCAAQGGSTEVVQLLLELGYDERSLATAMKTAVTYGNIDVMQLLVDRGALLDEAGEGFTPRTLVADAITGGQPEAVAWLLERSSPGGDLALLYAVRQAPEHSVVPICEVLLQHGAQDRDAHALFEAAKCGYAEVVQYLLKPGSEAGQEQQQQQEEQVFRWEVALCGAANMGRVEVVKELLEAVPPSLTAGSVPALPPASEPPAGTAGAAPTATPPLQPSSSSTSAAQASAPTASSSEQVATHAKAASTAGCTSNPDQGTAEDPLSPLLQILVHAVEAAATKHGKYRRPHHPRCQWITGLEDEGEVPPEHKWLWDLANEGYEDESYGWRAAVELLVAAGADPGLQEGRMVMYAVKQRADETLDVLLEARKDIPVVTDGIALGEAIEEGSWHAQYSLFWLAEKGSVYSCELRHMRWVAQDCEDQEMWDLITEHEEWWEQQEASRGGQQASTGLSEGAAAAATAAEAEAEA